MDSNGDSAYLEKRKHPRKSCLIAVECGIKDSVFVNYINNISNEGVFIETNEPFEIGQSITLKILAPYDLKNINHISGEVIRIESKGIAVKFKNDNDDEKANIQEFVENI